MGITDLTGKRNRFQVKKRNSCAVAFIYHEWVGLSRYNARIAMDWGGARNTLAGVLQKSLQLLGAVAYSGGNRPRRRVSEHV